MFSVLEIGAYNECYGFFGVLCDRQKSAVLPIRDKNETRFRKTSSMCVRALLYFIPF